MNRNEEHRDLSKKVLIALLSADDGSPVSDIATFQKNLAKLCVGYADALLDELDKHEADPKEFKKDENSEEIVQIRVATGEVQVGDMVMVSEGYRWAGPFLLQRIDDDQKGPFLVGDINALVGWRQARHLTDEERAKIKRI